MDDTQTDKELTLLETPEARKLYEEALARWEKKLKPLTDSIRRSQRITGDDLKIRVGPCDD